MTDKYVKWKYVEELIGLIKTRDSFNDWSDEYEKYNKKVKNTIEWLGRNAREIENQLEKKNDVCWVCKYPEYNCECDV